ncbi:MAG: HEPN domain-containing protein [Candidatus Lokiarchaeota archaeon]|nr:HEPN domain-containing protein [Candidatus Lokiarchaeota archaeon]
MFAKAWEKHDSAALLFEKGFLDDAISRAYYAVFHGVAVLLRDKNVRLAVHKHVYILTQFQKEFIMSGLIKQDTFKTIIAIKTRREIADYSFESQPSVNDVRLIIEDARSCLAEFEAYIAGRALPPLRKPGNTA